MINDGTEPYSLRSFHPRLFCVTASRFSRGCSMTAGFRAAVFVIGLQPTNCVCITTQGCAHLRFASPCARLCSPYRALLPATIHSCGHALWAAPQSHKFSPCSHEEKQKSHKKILCPHSFFLSASRFLEVLGTRCEVLFTTRYSPFGRSEWPT